MQNNTQTYQSTAVAIQLVLSDKDPRVITNGSMEAAVNGLEKNTKMQVQCRELSGME